MTTADAAAQPLLEVDEIAKSFGHVSVLRGVSPTVAPAQITALVGGNGAGNRH